jgi:cell division septum initiation protein DivIVA
MRQFSRTLFGANPAEVREFLLAAAASLERANDELAGVILERTALQTAVKQAQAEVERLRAELAEARDKLATYQGQEAVLGRAVVDARQVTEELSRSSRDQAERTIAQANATAKETLETARQSAAELLRAARAHAQQAVEAAERAAAARTAEIQIEADRIAAEVRSAAAEVRQGAERQIERFIARLEAFLANREELTGDLDALARQHAESLEVISRLHTEVEQAIVPALRELTQAVSRKAWGAREHRTPGPDDTSASAAAPPASAPVRSAHRRDPDRGGHAPSPHRAAEIVVSPISSYLQATKLVTSVSRIHGVKAARLRSYSKATITIDVVTEAGTVAAIDPRLINGGPLDVVEATDSRMVLRLGDVEAGRTAGSGSHVGSADSIGNSRLSDPDR